MAKHTSNLHFLGHLEIMTATFAFILQKKSAVSCDQKNLQLIYFDLPDDLYMHHTIKMYLNLKANIFFILQLTSL